MRRKWKLFFYLERWYYDGTTRKIRPQAKIDNFAFKNSNIIIEGLIWKRKDYFLWKKFETQKNNVINKFFLPKLIFLSLRAKFLKMMRF